MSASSNRYQVIGALGSPYSVKFRAIMRYRRLPFDWVPRNRADPDVAQVRPQIVPMLRYPEDGAIKVDSTPLAYDLERRHPERSIIPEDAGLAFLSHLIEDMGDEWGTKAMFHYRWNFEPDRRFCSRWLARNTLGAVDEAEIEAWAETFCERQVSRLPLVGCTPENAPLLEATYLRVLEILEAHLTRHDFMFGSRPALADFGWFGQLYQCAIDPTPMAIMRERAPGTHAWLLRVDDASGVDGQWIDGAAGLPESIVELLRLSGQVYLPFLLANAKAVAEGAEQVRFEAWGHSFSQTPFGYQGKCLIWLREELAALSGPVRERTAAVLKETGCWDALQS